MLASIFSEAVLEVFRTIGGIGVVVVVLGFLFKSFVKNLFKRDLQQQKAKMETELERLKNELSSEANKKLEILKSDLARNHDREIERFKSQLEIAAHERQTTFELMHRVRADSIAEVYTNMVKAFDAVFALRRLGPPVNAEAAAAQAKLDTFWSSFDNKRIFFTENLDPAFLDINNAMFRIIEVYRTDLGQGQGHTTEQLGEMDRLRQIVTARRAILADEFRKILGVIEENPGTRGQAPPP